MKEEKKLMEYAVRLLAGRRYHSAEIRKKLRGRTDDFELAENVIEKLNSYRYLDDAEYIRLYIADRLLLKPQGRRLIRNKLRQKNISSDEVDEQLELMENREYEMASLAAQKKIKSLKNESPQKRKEKLYRFLVSRGFENGAIVNAVKTHFDPLQNQ